MLQALQSTRARLRGHAAAGQDVIEFAVPHTLAFTFFPAWMSSLRERFGPIKSRLIALNVHDAVMRLVEGGCDLLIAYHHPSQPLQLDAERYEMVRLGQEKLSPYVKADADGAPLYRLPGRPGQPLPYLGYAPGAYLGGVTDLILKEAGTAIHLDRVYETDMAEGLKVMALEGHGVAFLPYSAVKKELREGKLVVRLNWGITDDPALFAESRKFRREHNAEVTAANAGERIWLRVERQTLRQLPRSGASQARWHRRSKGSSSGLAISEARVARSMPRSASSSTTAARLSAMVQAARKADGVGYSVRTFSPV